MEKIRSAVRAVGAPFSLRGVEAEVVGSLSGSKEAPVLNIARTGESVQLAPLTKKVQWDVKGRQVEPARRGERRAFARLMSRWDGSPTEIRVVGPLRAGRAGDPLHLEVRRYRAVK